MRRGFKIGLLSAFCILLAVSVFAGGSFEVPANSEVGVDFTNPYSKEVAISFSASGKWRVWSKGGYHTANGLLNYASGGMLKDAPNGALIVRRGNGRYEFVGESRVLILAPNEKLCFIINEGLSCVTSSGAKASCFTNNKGS